MNQITQPFEEFENLINQIGLTGTEAVGLMLVYELRKLNQNLQVLKQ